MRASDQHLSSQELEELAGAAAKSPAGTLENAMLHMDSCAQCRLKMLDLIANGGVRPRPVNARTAECPPHTVWLEMAAGVLPVEDRQGQLKHAVQCSRCAQLLKVAIEDLALELTSEEEQQVASLPSASVEWQKNMVQKIAETSRVPVTPGEAPASLKTVPKPVGGKSGRDKPEKIFAWPRWTWAAAAIVTAVASWWGWTAFRQPSVDQLLAQAYTDQRTIELRFPGAQHAELDVKRGPADGAHAPLALLKARPAIAQELAAHPDSVQWLQAQARAALLEWKYNAAIQLLNRALESNGSSQSLNSDLASAYFERAMASDQATDYAKANDILTNILAQNPNDEIALFNRAIVREHMSLYHEAVSDWKQYLNVDRDGGWAREAQQHLDDMQRKIQEHDRRTGQPPIGASAVA